MIYEINVSPIFTMLTLFVPLVTSDPNNTYSDQKHFQSLVLWLKHVIKVLKYASLIILPFS